ncbi:MAG: phosphoglycolate phosphatase [Gluconacetobacter diazotrophicus]|nr:phosphoglycolate phosphatase [Gluconacetobacter diazotrophicus]
MTRPEFRPAPPDPFPGRLLVLDLDGTLVDSIPDLMDSANRVLARRDLAPIRREEIRPMVGDGVHALIERVLISRGARPDERAASAFIADYAVHAADRSALFPGVAALLDEALAAGWRLAVCTNKPVAAARTLLDALGVSGRFAAIGGGDSFSSRKPDPGHLLGTVALAGAAPENAVLVGDHRNDVSAGRAAGIPVVFAGWGYGDPEDDAPAGVPVAPHPSAVLAEAGRLLDARAGAARPSGTARA